MRQQRRKLWPALLILSVLYIGIHFYWQKGALFGDGTDAARSWWGFFASTAYMLAIFWMLNNDTPQPLKDLPVFGRFIERFGKFTLWGAMAGGFAVWGMIDPDFVGYLFIGGVLLGFGTALALTMSWYDGDASSRLYSLKRLVDVYPSIVKPEGHVRFNQKLWTTTLVLIVYFIMTNVLLWGLSGTAVDIFSGFRAIMAGASGSIMHLGIGPIVTGSIVMQLFAGAKIIKLDLQDADDKQIYQGVQKVLVLIMIPVESIPQVYGFLDPEPGLIDNVGIGWANTIIVLQLFAGSYLVFLMDELVSKWGIGSGISLFIAAGVAQQLFVGTLSPLPTQSEAAYSVDNPPAGTLPMVLYIFRTATNPELISSGFETMLLTHANPIVALVSSVIVFIIVAYAEASKIELPLTHGKVRGHRGKYPIRLIYASNIPVILMAALLANVNMFTLLFWSHPVLSTVPVLGASSRFSIAPWMGTYEVGATTPSDGLAWYVSIVGGVNDWLIPILNQSGDGYGHELWQIIVHVVAYVTFMTLGSMMFAKFWIETTNMGSKDVAKQIERTGMQIPGFRKNPLVLEKILERYIPPVTLFSGAFVGLLAAGADLLGTVGNASGTGLLLAVGIVLRTYEQIQKEQAMEMHPALRDFFGVE